MNKHDGIINGHYYDGVIVDQLATGDVFYVSAALLDAYQPNRAATKPMKLVGVIVHADGTKELVAEPAE